MSERTNGNASRNLADWIAAWMQENLKLGDTEVARDRTFVKYGMDSVHAMMLVGDLEDLLDRRLSPTLAWDHPTVETLAGYLAGSSSEGSSLEKSAVPAPATGTPADLLDRLDELSEEEVDRLLEEHGNQEES